MREQKPGQSINEKLDKQTIVQMRSLLHNIYMYERKKDPERLGSYSYEQFVYLYMADILSQMSATFTRTS